MLTEESVNVKLLLWDKKTNKKNGKLNMEKCFQMQERMETKPVQARNLFPNSCMEMSHVSWPG